MDRTILLLYRDGGFLTPLHVLIALHLGQRGRVREVEISAPENRVGNCIVENIWKKLGSDILEQGGFNKHEKLTVLKPEAEVMWCVSGISILSYPTNFHDLIVSGQVEVLGKDIERLEGGNRIKFTDGTTIEIDTLLSSNG